MASFKGVKVYRLLVPDEELPRVFGVLHESLEVGVESLIHDWSIGQIGLADVFKASTGIVSPVDLSRVL